ncbi:MAG: PH domain-containing protein [Acidimicrobiia bacterium]
MNPTPEMPERYPRPGSRPTLLPQEPITRTHDPYAPPYEAFPDHQIRNVTFSPRWLRRRPPRFFADPDQILYSLLASKEVVVYAQSPSFSAFLLGNAPLLVLILFGGIVVNTSQLGADPMIFGILFIAVGVSWLLLAARWILRDRYTRYVLTTMRVMRVRGFLHRENAWIPLAKVTDVRYNSTLVGRMFGFAEIRIDSANEESGLKYMRNLDDPETFYENLLLLVEMKQGNITLEPPTTSSAPSAISGGGGGGGAGSESLYGDDGSND